MKKALVNGFLILAIVIHCVMLWNLAAHFDWKPGVPPEISPRKTGAATPGHWMPGKGLSLLSKESESRIADKWRQTVRYHVRSMELMALPPRQSDNFGLDLLMRDANNTDPGGDFFQLYRSGLDVRNGTSIYQNYPDDMDPRLKREMDQAVPFHPPNRYPPGFAWTIGLLLTTMKPWTAFWFWVIVHEIVLVFCIAKSWKLAAGSRVRFKIATAMWLAFLPWYLELYMGQTTFIIMAATFILAAHLDDRAGSFHAGVWWTVSLITKPITLLFAPVLIKKRRLGMLVTGLAVAIGSSALYFIKHPNDTMLFLRWMSGEEMVLSLGNYCFQALTYRFHTSDWVTRGFAVLFVLIGLYMTFRRKRTHPNRMIAIWVCIYFLAYTHVWEHHLVLFLPALILPWLYSGKKRYVGIWLLTACPSFFYFFNNHWNWTREILYLSGAALPVMLLFVDQLFFNPPRALNGD